MTHNRFSSSLKQELRNELRTRRFGRSLQAYEKVSSTNTVAAAWAARGAPEGSLVAAEFQTAGRGRMGRLWEATAGQNLTFSLVLRPDFSHERLGLITLAAGLAVAEAVEQFTAPLTPAIKWPNDILLNGRKCCGMLLESALTGAAAPVTVILGIGLNVNQASFPPELEARATSLLLETGRLTARFSLLAELLLRIETAYDHLLQEGGDLLRKTYTARLDGLGKEVSLHIFGSDRRVQGAITGISETGALRLLTSEGLRTFHAGEVTTQPPA